MWQFKGFSISQIILSKNKFGGPMLSYIKTCCKVTNIMDNQYRKENPTKGAELRI